MHQSFVSTAPTYGDSGGKPGYGAVQVLFDCPRSAGEVRVILTLGHLPL